MTLRFEDVAKTYGSVRALEEVTLTIEPGEMVTIHGASGSGKTTLLLLAAGLLVADTGRVTFHGRDIGKLSRNEAADFRREEVGVLLQRFWLLPGTPAVENAALKLLLDRVALPDARRQADRWLKRVGLGAERDRWPSKLSGGQQQRVALVRALLGQPAIVVADEPTGHLDSKGSREILDLLHEYAHERTAIVLVVTHDPQAAAIADRAFTMSDGHLLERSVADDTPDAPAAHSH
jgi:putative ABC transport system ATP-binding protein